MVIFGFAVVWFGYQQTIYGYVLLKGYNIRWRDLANPLNPYQWPANGATPPLIPKGQLLPGGTANPAATASSGPGAGSGQKPVPVGQNTA